MPRTPSVNCAEQWGSVCERWAVPGACGDTESVGGDLCAHREQARPLGALGAQSPFPVVQCDKFPCQILPAPLYF